MIEAIIFDLDGVIVDTAKYHFIAWQEMAASLGITFTKEDNESLKGVGRMESLDFILSLDGQLKSKGEKEKLAFKKNEHYQSLISNMSRKEILPGVIPFLEELQNNDIKIALGSSSKNARPILNTLDLLSFFDVIVDGANISKSKPDPQVFNMGSEQLDIPSKNIVVFEDAKTGIEAAKVGGFMSVGIGDSDVLSEADVVFQNMSGLTFDILKQSLNL